jgi:hypothetical protein
VCSDIFIRWIKKEVELNITTSEEAKEILGMTGEDPAASFARHPPSDSD